MERLKSLKYHPLRYIETEREISDSQVHKKLKTSCECKDFFFPGSVLPLHSMHHLLIILKFFFPLDNNESKMDNNERK